LNFLLLISAVFLAISSVLIVYRLGTAGIIIFLPAAFIPVFFPEYASSLSIFIVPLIFGAAGGYCLKKGKGLDIYLTMSAMAFAVLFTGNYYLIKSIHDYDMVAVSGQNLIQKMEESEPELEKIFQEYNTPAENREIIKGDFQKTLKVLKDRKWLQFARDMLPIISFLYSLVIASLSFFFLKKFFLKKDGEKMKSLEYYKMNDYLIFIFIGSWAFFLILDSNLFPLINIVSLNIALMLSILYAIQALGIAKFFLIRRGLPLFLLPLLVVLLIMLGIPAFTFVSILLTGIGTLDLWADFRKLAPEKNEIKRSKQ
jgi:hypothetical protein